ncbi:MAG: hypothetical protein FWF06_08770 [Symbiobacteriaceae bacterium]|nr:hypothetical protein [Symbiobacteriaceae bacterium]
MDMLDPLKVWIGAFLTLGIYSLLYQENPIYRFCEYLYVGVSAAHTLVTTFANTVLPGIQVQMIQNGQYWEIIPILLGCMIYFQPFKTAPWLARYPTTLWVGYYAGYALTLRTAVPLLTQVRQTIMPVIVVVNETIDVWGSFNNIVFMASVLLVMTYFLFSINGLQGRSERMLQFSRLLIMVAFGAGFANGVATRVSLLIGRLDFLFSDWLQVY